MSLSAKRDRRSPHADGSPPDGAPAPARWWSARRGLVAALIASIAVHVALSFMPDDLPRAPERTILAATLRELPPPPVPQAVPAPDKPKPKAKPKARARAPIAAPVLAPLAALEPMPGPEAFRTPEAQGTGDADAIPMAPPEPEPAPPPVLAEDVAPSGTPVERKTLPPRVDLAYKVFYGTQGFQIGNATYRFEHAQNRYTIATVAEASGLAALLFRGKGRMESKGLITAVGLQPHEFVVDKFNRRGAERAEFDWETGIATLHDNKTAALELPTFDLLALMWQFYFQPPQSGRQSFSIATTRRVNRVTLTKEREETIEWAHGAIATEVWHRTSQDGKTEAHVWLAPSLRWIPVKMRVVNTRRGTVEALLDAIRVDEANGNVDETNTKPDDAPAAPQSVDANAARAGAESPYTALATQ